MPGRVLIVLTLVATLTGCAPSERAAERAPRSGTSPGSAVSALSLAPGESRYVLDPADSRLLFYTYRGGKLAQFGHNHVVLARGVAADIAFNPALTGSRFRLRVPLAQLEVDDPQLRAAAGPDFDTKPSAEDVAATKTNMLGERGLDAAKYPSVSVSGRVTEADGANVKLTLALNIHGIKQSQSVPTTVSLAGGQMRIRGALKLNQTDYGITPFSVMLGALTVLDEVAVEFDLAARPAT